MQLDKKKYTQAARKWYESTVNNIKAKGGSEDTIDIWDAAYSDICYGCDITEGIADSYTRDLILCWVGYAQHAGYDDTCTIYDSATGYQVSVKDNANGATFVRRIYDGINENAPDPMSVKRELAKDQLERMGATIRDH